MGEERKGERKQKRTEGEEREKKRIENLEYLSFSKRKYCSPYSNSTIFLSTMFCH
jgi:hypothetical protein